MKPTVEMWPVAKLRPRANEIRQSRKEFKIESLTKRIMLVGFLYPILIRILADGFGEVQSGWTRVLAAINAGLTEVPAIVQDHSATVEQEDLEEFYSNSLATNFTLPERANFYLRLRTRHGWSNKEIAANIIGVNETDVCRALRTYDLAPTEVMKMLVDGLLPGTFGPIIVRAKTPEQMIQWAKKACADEPNGKPKMKKEALLKAIKTQLGERTKKLPHQKMSADDGVSVLAPADADNETVIQSLQGLIVRLRKGIKLAGDDDATGPVLLNPQPPQQPSL